MVASSARFQNGRAQLSATPTLRTTALPHVKPHLGAPWSCASGNAKSEKPLPTLHLGILHLGDYRSLVENLSGA